MIFMNPAVQRFREAFDISEKRAQLMISILNAKVISSVEQMSQTDLSAYRKVPNKRQALFEAKVDALACMIDPSMARINVKDAYHDITRVQMDRHEPIYEVAPLKVFLLISAPNGLLLTPETVTITTFQAVKADAIAAIDYR